MVPAAHPVPPLPERLRRRVADEGPLSFSAFMEAALYDPSGGFYAAGGHAGRRGDFLTSVEVGPLFGAVLARALDGWWHELGRPDPFVLLEAGAGPGTLARTVARAAPQCSAALVHVLIERSAAQRARHGEHLPTWVGELGAGPLTELMGRSRSGSGPVVASSPTWPDAAVTGVVLANELLDNLPFDIVRRSSTDLVEEYRVGVSDDGGFVPVVVARVGESTASPDAAVAGGPAGAWMPFEQQAVTWVATATAALRRGHVMVFDYAASDAELHGIPDMGWLRTFRGHERGSHPLDDPGSQDITADVAVDQLHRAHPGAYVSTQAEFLVRHGIEALVEEGRRIWNERAHRGDLEAVYARSRVGEAEALLDPDGLGGFAVLDWTVSG